jgi:hypothetical protein
LVDGAAIHAPTTAHAPSIPLAAWSSFGSSTDECFDAAFGQHASQSLLLGRAATDVDGESARGILAFASTCEVGRHGK